MSSSDSESCSSGLEISTPSTAKAGALQALASGCCKQRCLQQLSLQDLIHCREFYTRLGTQAAQRKYVYTLRLAAHWEGYYYRDRKICQRAFRQLYGISQSKLRRVERSRSSDVLPRQQKEVRSAHLRAFLTAFFNEHGECSPVINNEIHMPQWMAQKDIHRWYTAQLPEHCGKPLSLSRLNRLLNSEFRHVKFPAESRFSKCSTCVQLAQASFAVQTDEEKDRVRVNK